MRPIPLIKPAVRFQDVEDDFRRIFESGRFTQGPYTVRFEERLAELFSARRVLTTSSCTAALYSALRALGVGSGHRVAVADFSFPATSNAVEMTGARPVFVDVDPETYNMSAPALEQTLQQGIRAVVFVDAFGNPTGLDAVMALCAERGVPVIEDAACAIGSRLHGQPCGCLTGIGCFSFHPRKLVTTGEGGAVALSDPELAERIETFLNQGAVVRDGALSFEEPGFKLRLPELQAAMGLAQLDSLGSLADRRRELLDEYVEGLTPLGFAAQRIGSGVEFNAQSAVFTVPQGVNRDVLVRRLRDRGVECTLGTYSLSATAHNERTYGPPNPVSLRLQRTTLTLPLFPGLVVERVVDAVGKCLEEPFE